MDARLKLGDFGIVQQQSDRRGITARTMNAMTAPSDILAGNAPKWQARDDVYQVGQLLAMLVRGDARSRVRTADVRELACSDHLKEIVYRCIGERRKRYESADELVAALRTPPAPSHRRASARSRACIWLSPASSRTRRSEAAPPPARAGAIVHGGPSAQTTVVVRGRPNAQQAAGRDGGLKLMEIKRLREKGHRIMLLSEAAVLAAGRPAAWRAVRAALARQGPNRTVSRDRRGPVNRRRVHEASQGHPPIAATRSTSSRPTSIAPRAGRRCRSPDRARS